MKTTAAVIIIIGFTLVLWAYNVVRGKKMDWEWLEQED